MATGDLAGSHEPVPAAGASQPLAIRTNNAAEAAAHSQENGGSKPFDIVETYHHLLESDPEISMPVAAIEALIALLGSTPATTAMETVDVVRSQAERLKRAVPNPIPLTAGTDLFQQYLLRSLKGQAVGGPPAPLSHRHDGGTGVPGTSSPVAPFLPSAAVPSFDETRQHLLRNSRLFAARAKAARDAIADRGRRYVLDGSVVLAAGGSRTVKTLLLRAADHHVAQWGAPRFRVVYVLDDHDDACRGYETTTTTTTTTVDGGSGKGDGSGNSSSSSRRIDAVGRSAVAALRERGVPTATIGPAAVAHVLQAARVDMAFVGTEVVVQNGGLLSRMGTFQLATLCRAANTPFYVAAETHKIVRLFPLGQADLPRCGVQQDVLDFRTSEDEGTSRQVVPGQIPVDYTPPALISAIITEQGIKLPAAVYSMLLDIYT